MKVSPEYTRRAIQTALAALLGAFALPAAAVSIPFSQSPGWFMGAPTSVAWTGFAPQAGGVEFYNGAAMLPLMSPPFPTSTFPTIGWGCVNSVVSTCAAGAAGSWPLDPSTAALVTTATDPTTISPGRSALRVTGNSGFLDDASWTDLTTVQHFNHVINGNSLSLAQVQSFLRLNGQIVDIGGGPSLTTVDFMETPNTGPCTQVPVAGAPMNPLGTTCDDFAVVSGLDLSPIQLSPTLGVQFRLNVPPNLPGNESLVCPSPPDPNANPPYPGCSFNDPGNLIIYTGENSDNTFSIQAQLFTITPNNPIPAFVIGDCEFIKKNPHGEPDPSDTNNLREVGDTVNFWGSQWWKNNCLSNGADNGYPAFKGFATNVVINQTGTPNCGLWQARPGNSGHPPDKSVIGNPIVIIVTDRVNKQGPNIGGVIKQLVLVDRTQPLGLDNYDGNPGHQGWGTITAITCGTDPGAVP